MGLFDDDSDNVPGACPGAGHSADARADLVKTSELPAAHVEGLAPGEGPGYYSPSWDGDGAKTPVVGPLPLPLTVILGQCSLPVSVFSVVRWDR